MYTAQPIGLGIASETDGGLKGRDKRATRSHPRSDPHSEMRPDEGFRAALQTHFDQRNLGPDPFGRLLNLAQLGRG